MAAERNLDVDRYLAVAVCPVASDLTVHGFVRSGCAFHTAVHGGTENGVREAGLVFIGGDTADVFIHEGGKVGEHMVVVRAAAVPAFPERRRTEVDPSLAAGERSLREHSVADVAFAHRAERVHNELVAEHAEIEMPIGRFDLADESVEKSYAFFLGLIELEVEHRCGRGLAIAHHVTVFFVEEFFAEHSFDLFSHFRVVDLVFLFTEHLRHLNDSVCRVIEEAGIGNLSRTLVVAHVLAESGTFEGRTPVARTVVERIVCGHRFHKVAVALDRVVVLTEDLNVAVIEIDVVRNHDERAGPVGTHKSVVAPACGRNDAGDLTRGTLRGSHILAPFGEDRARAEVGEHLLGGERNVARPAVLFSVRTVCGDGVHIGDRGPAAEMLELAEKLVGASKGADVRNVRAERERRHVGENGLVIDTGHLNVLEAVVCKDRIPNLFAVALFDVFIRLEFAAANEAADRARVDLAVILENVGITEGDLRACGASDLESAYRSRSSNMSVTNIAGLLFGCVGWGCRRNKRDT